MDLQILIPIAVMFFLFFIRLPVAFAIFIATLSYFLFFNEFIPLDTVIQKLIASTESFPYLAIPFFTCAGVMFNYAGITRRLMDLAELLVGHLQGGLAQVNILVSTLMGGLSGSANADAAMNSKMLVPEMLRRGYDKGFSAAVTASSSCITPIIPPGIILILYATIADVSVARMFFAGYLPGIFMCIGLMFTTWLISRRRGYQPSRSTCASIREILLKALDAIWALLLPFGILMGLRFGMFTPTEAGGISVFYALIVGVFIYRELRVKDLWPIIQESVLGTAGVMFIIGSANAFSLYLTWESLPMMVTEIMVEYIHSPIVMLLVINFLLLVLGCFFDGGAAMILLAPLLVPVAQEMKVDLIHFGIVMCINLTLGGITPPFGNMMFVTISITETKMEEYIVASIPFIICLVLLLFVFTFIPDIILIVPRLLL